jgi:hypothetical protein
MAPGLIQSWSGGQTGSRTGRPDRWIVYSARAAGGLLGAGGGGLLVSAAGFAPAFVASAIVAGAAALVPLLYRPGLPRTIPEGSRKTGEVNDHGA